MLEEKTKLMRFLDAHHPFLMKAIINLYNSVASARCEDMDEDLLSN